MREGRSCKEVEISRDITFYSSFFSMFAMLTMQNIVTYSVNIADNIMLGAYNQQVLAGAAAVNQIQYVLQQFTVMGLGQGVVILGSQYWGQGNTLRQQQAAGTALLAGWGAGLLLLGTVSLWPRQVIGIFTDEPAVQQAAMEYLTIVRWGYLAFITNQILLAALRSMQVVKIAFQVSVAALLLNVSVNYVLIFGHFGAPELGIRGCAIGTVAARFSELLLVLSYLRFGKLPLRLRFRTMLRVDKQIGMQYAQVSLPCIASSLLFSCASAIHTAVYGHLSEDAMAASSAAGTMFQYCKMIPTSAAAAANTWIGKTVGSGRMDRVKEYVRTLQVLFAVIGVVTCLLLLVLRGPVLSLYSITPRAMEYARQMTLIQALISIGMAYQMPCQVGILHGGGETRYSMISDIIYSWLYTVPLGLLTAFVLHWPFPAVVFCLNSDQLLKCVTVGIKVNSYDWIRQLTKLSDQKG